MLSRRRRAGWRSATLRAALAFVFALAPAVSMALAVPAGAYARTVMHVHPHDADGHVDRALGHGPVTDHNDAHYHQNTRTDQSQHDEDGDQPRLHMHFEACSPSVVLPVLNTGTLQQCVSQGIAVPPMATLRGAAPDRLLRPPIPKLVL